MKKIISAILSLVLLVMCAASAFAAESAAGIWYLTSAALGEVTIDAAALGMNMVLLLNEDGSAAGTYEFEGESDTATGNWTQDGAKVTISFEGDDVQEAVLEGDRLLIEEANSGVVMICTREEPALGEVPAYVPGIVRTDAVLDEYIGQWECLIAEAAGQQMETTALNLVMLLDVREDGISYYANNAGQEVDAEFTLKFSDGAVHAIQDGNEMWSLQLLDDGVMLLTIAGLNYYFTPVAVEEVPAA